jgi:ADP-ribosylglycohydrolase
MCMESKKDGTLPRGHSERMKRALLSLDGLSIGDSFGECFFASWQSVERRLEYRDPPPPPWRYTDDTKMALSIVRILNRYGRIEQEALARAFSQEYAKDPDRGYGGMAQQILKWIGQGVSWKTAARRAFDGQGSCGNGGAMRVAPVGAYFADDYERVVFEAKLSAEVTHAHPDGQTGAAAVALASAWMVREAKPGIRPGRVLIEFVLQYLPKTKTYSGLKKALDVPFDAPPQSAAAILGNGTRVIASDTVPFCIWCAARQTDSYTDALWTTVSGLGDRDTTCAIVGGIVSLATGRKGIPARWLNNREPLSI